MRRSSTGRSNELRCAGVVFGLPDHKHRGPCYDQVAVKQLRNASIETVHQPNDLSPFFLASEARSKASTSCRTDRRSASSESRRSTLVTRTRCKKSMPRATKRFEAASYNWSALRWDLEVKRRRRRPARGGYSGTVGQGHARCCGRSSRRGQHFGRDTVPRSEHDRQRGTYGARLPESGRDSVNGRLGGLFVAELALVECPNLVHSIWLSRWPLLTHGGAGRADLATRVHFRKAETFGAQPNLRCFARPTPGRQTCAANGRSARL